MTVGIIVMQKEPKGLMGSGQKAIIRDELLAIQLTQTINVFGEKVNPKSIVF
jgi:hypothetical protein